MWIPEEHLVAPGSHLVLSPHYDDAALSCGGLLALLGQDGRRPRVTVLFGAEPDPATPLTEFAAFQHQRWGLPPGAVIAGRRQEETAALDIFRAESEILPFADAIYRGDAYTTEASLFSPPVAIEAALPDEIIRALALPTDARAETRIYAPRALGGHVDHRLARLVGQSLAVDGWEVWFYEDIPYALTIDDTAAEIDGDLWEPLLVDITAGWRKKIAAVAAYQSQNPVIFRHLAPGGDAAGIERVLATHAEQLGGGGRKAERYWRPASRETRMNAGKIARKLP